jgi:hypothetical protein
MGGFYSCAREELGWHGLVAQRMAPGSALHGKVGWRTHVACRPKRRQQAAGGGDLTHSCVALSVHACLSRTGGKALCRGGHVAAYVHQVVAVQVPYKHAERTAQRLGGVHMVAVVGVIERLVPGHRGGAPGTTAGVLSSSVRRQLGCAREQGGLRACTQVG